MRWMSRRVRVVSARPRASEKVWMKMCGSLYGHGGCMCSGPMGSIALEGVFGGSILLGLVWVDCVLTALWAELN